MASSEHEIKNSCLPDSYRNKVFTLSISETPHGYLILRNGNTKYEWNSCYITAIIRDPYSMIYNQDIKYVSTALLGHVLKYFNDNIKMDYDQQPVLVIYPINPFVLTTALSLGFMPAPNCGCKRKKCTHSTSCITERSNIDTWCPTVKSWQNWIKKAELEPVIF